MLIKKKIAFLFDKKNPWLLNYLPLLKKLPKNKYKYSFFKNYKKVNLKNTFFLSKKIISIPLNYDISKINLKKICNIFNNNKDFKVSLNIQKNK
jgi:dTDP-4-amino-4,6-dideoxygalactose transaminase